MSFKNQPRGDIVTPSIPTFIADNHYQTSTYAGLRNIAHNATSEKTAEANRSAPQPSSSPLGLEYGEVSLPVSKPTSALRQLLQSLCLSLK